MRDDDNVSLFAYLQSRASRLNMKKCYHPVNKGPTIFVFLGVRWHPPHPLRDSHGQKEYVGTGNTEEYSTFLRLIDETYQYSFNHKLTTISLFMITLTISGCCCSFNNKLGEYPCDATNHNLFDIMFVHNDYMKTNNIYYY